MRMFSFPKAKSYHLKVPTLRSGSRLHVGTNEAGFTLIEIMVSVSLFAIVAVIVSGALVTISDVNRKAQAIKLAMDNVSFAMDSMVANLREAAQIGCSFLGTGCIGGQEIIFESKRTANPGEIVRYRLLEDVNGLGSIQIGRGTPLYYVDMTSAEVDIQSIRFYVPNIGSTGENSRVTLVIRGEVPGKNPTKFNLQTTIKANF